MASGAPPWSSGSRRTDGAEPVLSARGLPAIDALLSLAARFHPRDESDENMPRGSCGWFLAARNDQAGEARCVWAPDPKTTTFGQVDFRVAARHDGISIMLVDHRAAGVDQLLTFSDACASRPLIAWGDDGDSARPSQRSGDPGHLLWLITATDGNHEDAYVRARTWLLEQETRLDSSLVLAEPLRVAVTPPDYLVLTQGVSFSTTLAPFELGYQPVPGATLRPFYPVRPGRIVDSSRDSDLTLRSAVYVAWGWSTPANRDWVDYWLSGLGAAERAEPEATPWSRVYLISEAGPTALLPDAWHQWLFRRLPSHTPLRLQSEWRSPFVSPRAAPRPAPPKTLGQVDIRLQRTTRRLLDAQHPDVIAAVKRLDRDISIMRRRRLLLHRQIPAFTDAATQVLGWYEPQSRTRFQDLLLSEPAEILSALRYSYVPLSADGSRGIHLIACGVPPVIDAENSEVLPERELLDMLEEEHRPDLTWYFDPSWRTPVEGRAGIHLAIPRGWSLRPSIVPWRVDADSIEELLTYVRPEPDGSSASGQTTTSSPRHSNAARLVGLFPRFGDVGGVVLLLPAAYAEEVPVTALGSSAETVGPTVDGPWEQSVLVYGIGADDWTLVTDVGTGGTIDFWGHFTRQQAQGLSPVEPISRRAAELATVLHQTLVETAGVWDAALPRAASQLGSDFNAVRDGYIAALEAMQSAVALERKRYDGVAHSLEQMRTAAEVSRSNFRQTLKQLFEAEQLLHNEANESEQAFLDQLQQLIAEWQSWSAGTKARLEFSLRTLEGKARELEPRVREELATQLLELARRLGSPRL